VRIEQRLNRIENELCTNKKPLVVVICESSGPDHPLPADKPEKNGVHVKYEARKKAVKWLRKATK